jgi:hypothetical protein
MTMQNSVRPELPPTLVQWSPIPDAPQKRPKRLLLALCAAISVLVIVGLVTAIVLTTGKRGGVGSAGDVVKAYLEALAKGDADTALGLAVAQPASKKFLAHATLAQQIYHMPIRNIAILEDSSKTESGDLAVVRAAADFGEKHSVGLIQVKRSEGVWKLATATVNIDTGARSFEPGVGAASTLTVLGQRLEQDEHVYVFPGYLGMESVRYVDVIAPPVLLESLIGDIPTVLNVAFSVNDAGHDAVNTALKTWLHECLTAPDRTYKCEPLRTEAPIDPATAKITGPIDLSRINQILMPMTVTVRANGIARYNATAQTPSGQTVNFGATWALDVFVNLADQPPSVGPTG